MNGQRPVPCICTKVDHQRNDRRDLVAFVESGQVFAFRMPAVCRFSVLCCDLTHLLAVLERIIDHVPHRHRIMNIRLVLDAEKNVRGPVILLYNRRLQNITVLLHRLFVFVCKRKRDFGGVQFFQTFRFDDLPAVVDQIVERIGKYRVSAHISLRYSIGCSHRVSPLFLIVS